MSTTPRGKTRGATKRGERPVASPGKSPDAKRTSTVKSRTESHALTKKAITAKAKEGAAKYLDGDFGAVGGNAVRRGTSRRPSTRITTTTTTMKATTRRRRRTTTRTRTTCRTRTSRTPTSSECHDCSRGACCGWVGGCTRADGGRFSVFRRQGRRGGSRGELWLRCTPPGCFVGRTRPRSM